MVAALSAGGRALELGVGTGRVLLPLEQRGVPVVGIDSSSAMLERLAQKRRAERGAAVGVLADMTTLPFAPAAFSLVFAAYNTIFNLTDAAATSRCFDEVGRVLARGGAFVVESFVAGYDGDSHSGVEVRSIGIDRVVLSASMLRTDDQTIAGQHIEISESGIRMRPWYLRYLDLDQLDAVAGSRGFVLAERWADWERAPFTSDADTHVSVYRWDRSSDRAG
jgi:ubiquinone/menaquinone biosynthesis C-methylase UbiE